MNNRAGGVEMTDVTIKQFATVVGIPVDRLLVQLDEAGIKVTGSDATITDQQKVDLLAHLRRSHGKKGALGISEPKKITLNRKTHSEIKMASGMGQVKTVSVEVRKKRTYVKRSVVLEEEHKRRDQEARKKSVAEARRRGGTEVWDKIQEEEARRKAEAEAKRKAEEEEPRRKVEEEETRRKAEEEAKRKAEEEAQRKVEEEETRRKAEEEAKRKAEEEARRKAEEETQRKAEQEKAQHKTEGEAPHCRKAENRGDPNPRACTAYPQASGWSKRIRRQKTNPYRYQQRQRAS